MKAQKIVSAVQEVASDVDGITYTTVQVTEWINDAIRALLIKRPDALVVLRNITPVAGTKQTIPADTHKLLGLMRNMGIDGNTPGRAIRGPVAQEELDAFDTGWHNATATAEASEYIYNIVNPLDYYLIPPNLGTVYDATIAVNSFVTGGNPSTIFTATAHGYIAGDRIGVFDASDSLMSQYDVLSILNPTTFQVDTDTISNANGPHTVKKITASPSQIEARLALSEVNIIDPATEDIPVVDVYAPALIEWCLYRLFARDSEKTPNAQRARVHYLNFMALLDSKTQMDAATTASVVENV